jgi:signal peptidase I
MTSVAVATKPKNLADNASSPDANVQSVRETVESIVVAFILAFLFRAFVAEAFVIPTGSMAPTLMGAHKDIECEFCGSQYQAGASREFDQDDANNVPGFRFGQQAQSGIVSIASTCPTCRGVNAYDFANNKNHATFSGDRILVSKFDYVLANPKRWDVFVFKYPREARMNYIKRLVGLPGEELLIRDGDVYTKTADGEDWSIARKPPHKINAMRRVVSDTKHIAAALVKQGWPSLWQPLNSESSSWTVEQTEESWSAKLSSSPQTQWLRYYHKFVPETQWLEARQGAPIPATNPKFSQLITDYLAYNSSYLVDLKSVYNESGKLRAKSKNEEDNSVEPIGIKGEARALDLILGRVNQNFDVLRQEDGPNNDGFHWVGDLIGEYDVEVLSDAGKLYLDLVEFGIHFQCEIDVTTGQAALSAIEDGKQIELFNGPLTAQTKVQGKGKYRLQMANVDDQIVLWVNNAVVAFSSPTTFDSYRVRSAIQRRPHWTKEDPLDAAPLAVGGMNLELSINRAAVYRDIYYIAVQNTMSNDYSDYDWGNQLALRAAIPDAQLRNRADAKEAISLVYSHPEWWSETSLFGLRGELRFELEADQYFPMGDNSSASSDARAWRGHNYVEKKFLLGKALLVFWPHTWNRPIPFTPNFERFGLIR